jgi:hypothetical protein
LSAGLLAEVSAALEVGVGICDSRLVLPLLGFPHFARVVGWAEYDGVVRAKDYNTATLALGIMTELLIAGEKGWIEYFDGIGAIVVYAEVFLEEGPCEALLGWIRFCLAVAQHRKKRVRTIDVNAIHRVSPAIHRD